ncbi:MAG: GxxExxY protein [Bacteroidota bacterium]
MQEQDYNLITHKVIKCAIEVHKYLGPGLMESVYEACLYREIQSAGLYIERQKVLPVVYKGIQLDKDFIIDQLVENEIVLELKSIDGILPIHDAQLLTYLRLSNRKLGLLINFNVTVLKDGIRRKINGKLNHK